MVLGKPPVQGRPISWITEGQRPTALEVGAGAVLWTFLLSSVLSLSPRSPSLWLWLVGCFGFNGPLRQYFSLYRAVSQRQ